MEHAPSAAAAKVVAAYSVGILLAEAPGNGLKRAPSSGKFIRLLAFGLNEFAANVYP